MCQTITQKYAPLCKVEGCTNRLEIGDSILTGRCNRHFILPLKGPGDTPSQTKYERSMELQEREERRRARDLRSLTELTVSGRLPSDTKPINPPSIGWTIKEPEKKTTNVSRRKMKLDE